MSFFDNIIMFFVLLFKVIGEIFQDLERFGERVATSIRNLGWECELNQPRLEQYDAWGKRVDRLITCSAWKELKAISAEEGLIAIAYERKYDEWRYARTSRCLFFNVNLIILLLYISIAFCLICNILLVAAVFTFVYV